METGIYVGSFDPLHLGHVNVIEQALDIFKHIRILVANNSEKTYLFTKQERADMIHLALSKYIDRGQISVDILEEGHLCIDYCMSNNIVVQMRSIRDNNHFCYEKAIRNLNYNLNPFIRTLYLIPDPRYADISSYLVKTIAKLGRSVDDLVPHEIATLVTLRTRGRS